MYTKRLVYTWRNPEKLAANIITVLLLLKYLKEINHCT